MGNENIWSHERARLDGIWCKLLAWSPPPTRGFMSSDVVRGCKPKRGQRQARTITDTTSTHACSAMPAICIVANDMTVYDVEVTPVGPDLYRLNEEPGLFFAADDEEDAASYPRYGDVIRATVVGDNTVRYESVYQRGSYQHYVYTISEAIGKSPDFSKLLEKIVRLGGHWERHMEGILLISIPYDTNFDMKVEWSWLYDE